MNDSDILQCADHGGEYGLSCGFFGKYPSLADAHVTLVHLHDKVSEMSRLPQALRQEVYPAEVNPPITTMYGDEPNYAKRYVVAGPATRLVSLLALYLVLCAAIITLCGAVIWFANQVASWF